MALTSKTQSLSRGQVAKVFADYGYKPTDNDLIYWASKPDSAYATLVSNLKIRRQKEDDLNLKNDIEKRKMTQGDSSTPKSTAKENINNRDIESNIGGKRSVYSLGEYGLIKFDNEPTVWLVDTINKELRPFLNEETFNLAYSPNPQNAWKSIQTISKKELTDKNGAFNSYNVLSSDYGVGVVEGKAQFLKDPDFRKGNLEKNYGKAENLEKAWEAHDNLFSILTSFAKNNKSKISPDFLEEIKRNPDLTKFYAKAIAYGEYTLNDIYKDIKKREASKNGDKSYDNVRYIDDSLTRGRFVATQMGKIAIQDSRINVPTEFIADNPDLWNSPISRYPQDAFRSLNPEYDLSSEKNKTEMSKIQSAFHEALSAKLNANTESQKDYADYQYDLLVDDIEKQYGIKLSSNATQAWNQLENLSSTASEAGLADSGVAQEQIDDYLKSARKQGVQLREQKLSDEEKQQADYIRKFGSSSDIKKLDDEDRAKGLPPDQWRSEKWGLKPSKEILSFLSTESLKAKFPEMTDEEIANYRNQIVDENGNMRSDLYAKQYENLYKIRKGKTMEEEFSSSTPDLYDEKGNIIQLGRKQGESLEEYRKRVQTQKLLNQELKEKKEYTERQRFSEESIVPEKKEDNLPPEKPATEWKFDKDHGKWIEQEVQPKPPKTGIEDFYEGKVPGTWTPSEGKQHILTPDDQSKYINIEKDPYSDKLYGTPKTITGYDQSGKAVQVPKGQYVPGISLTPPKQVTQPIVTTKQNVPQQMITGYNQSGQAVQVPSGQYVPGISLTPPKPQVNLPVAPKTPTPIPQIPKTPTQPTWNLPSGYEKISGALYNTKEKQQGAYSNIQKDPTGTFLYGKKK